MKKSSSAIISILSAFALLTLLTACSAGTPSTQNLQGKFSISGSTALQPLTTAAALAYEKLHPQVQIDVQGGGSVTGLKNFSTKVSDIGDSDLYADPVKYPDPTITDHIVCAVPFNIIVGADIPATMVTSLTKQQIIDIFSTNKIRNWSDVGGPNLKITPIVRPATSGTRATFRTYVLGGKDESGTVLTSDSSTTVRDTVASTSGAIGYVGSAYLTSSVRALNIDGIDSSLPNIESGKYNFWSYEHMYTLGVTNPLVSDFFTYMYSSAGQQLAQSLTYIPLASIQSPTANTVTSPSASSNNALYKREVA